MHIICALLSVSFRFGNVPTCACACVRVHACAYKCDCFGHFCAPLSSCRPWFTDLGQGRDNLDSVLATHVQKINPSFTRPVLRLPPPSTSSLSHLSIFPLPSQPLLHPFFPDPLHTLPLCSLPSSLPVLLLSSLRLLPPPPSLKVIDSAQCCYFIQRAL